jgi:hypothetical protein
MQDGRPRASRFRLRHEVTVFIGAPLSGDVGAERLERRVLELGTLAVESRQRPTATRSQRFTGAAERHSSPAAAADSTGQRLSDGPTIAPARRASEEAENNDAN